MTVLRHNEMHSLHAHCVLGSTVAEVSAKRIVLGTVKAAARAVQQQYSMPFQRKNGDE
jgi:hypothetical protein